MSAVLRCRGPRITTTRAEKPSPEVALIVAIVPTSAQRRLCRPSDCADFDTACGALWEIPTRDIGTILSGYAAALLRLGAIARAGLACCCLMLGDALGVEALVLMRFRLETSGALFRVSARDASVRSASTRVRPLGLCRPHRPTNPPVWGVQERRRHNPQVGTIGDPACTRQ
jgi:hypothetical protein